MSLYEEDLAYVHAAGFVSLVELAADKVVELLDRSGIDSGLVVDIGCGNGLVARLVSGKGFRVMGIDVSPAMIALARESAPQAQFVVGSYQEAKLPSCVAVVAVGEVLGYMLEDGSHHNDTGSDIINFFIKAYKALRPGGLLVFDLAGPGRVAGGVNVRNYFVGEGWYVLTEVAEDSSRGVLVRDITTFRRVGDLYRQSRELHRLKLYPPAEILGLLREIGFTAQTRKAYRGSRRFAPGHNVFVARKPSA